MEFLRFLEGLRVPGLNEFFLAITELGGELPFLVIAIIVFWCVDKRRGYYVLSVGFLGTLSNQFLKLLCRVPRPWVQDPNFTILEQAREAATGYSFPSGHTQNAVGTFGSIAYTEKWKWLRWTCIVIAALIAFSRMYVGVHFPSDVLVAAGMALLLIVILKPVVFSHDGKYIPVLLGVMALLCIAYLVYVEVFPFPADIDAHNLASAMKNAYTLTGCLAGLLIVYFVDEKYLRFPTQAVWWAQIIKIVVGLGIVLLVKEGTRSLLDAAFAGHLAARAVRYFLVVLTAGLVWPLSFPWFAKLGKKG